MTGEEVKKHDKPKRHYMHSHHDGTRPNHKAPALVKCIPKAAHTAAKPIIEVVPHILTAYLRSIHQTSIAHTQPEFGEVTTVFR